MSFKRTELRPADDEHRLATDVLGDHPQIPLDGAEATRLLDALNKTDKETVARLRSLRERA